MAKEKESTGFGARLKALRLAARLTQEQLADKAGMLPQHITRLERGGRSPTWETVLRLSKALGVSTDAFKQPEDE